MFPSPGNHRPVKELLSLKEIVENNNAAEKNSRSAVPHLAQISAAKETAASQRAALMSPRALALGHCEEKTRGQRSAQPSGSGGLEVTSLVWGCYLAFLIGPNPEELFCWCLGFGVSSFLA